MFTGKARAASLAVLLAGSAFGMVCSTSPASASPIADHVTAVPIVAKAVTAPMNATGIDRAVARAHGYTVITLAGEEISIKNKTLAKLGSHPSKKEILANASSIVGSGIGGGVQPNNTVYGNCGSSNFFLAIYSNGAWDSLTGYDVRDAVASKSWHTYLQDPSGSLISGTEYDSGPTGPSWTGSDASPPDLTARGVYLGGVDVGTATLVDGTTCVSGDPADSQTY